MTTAPQSFTRVLPQPRKLTVPDRDAHDRRVSRLRLRRNGGVYFGGILGAGGALLVALSGPDGPRWFAPSMILVFTLLYVSAATGGMNSAYRIGYSRGMAIALRRATKGLLRNNEGKTVKVRAGVPNIWEDDLAIEEVQRSTSNLFEMVDDDEPYSATTRPAK